MTEFGLPSDGPTEAERKRNEILDRMETTIGEVQMGLGVVEQHLVSDNVRPLRPVLVEPGESVDDAAWRAGWKACDDAGIEARVEWHRRGYAQGFAAGRAAGPTWANLCIVAAFAFAVGGMLAYAYVP